MSKKLFGCVAENGEEIDGKEFEKLQKENEKIREDIDKLLDIPKLTTTKKYFKASIWEKIKNQ